MKDKTYYLDTFNDKWDTCLKEAEKDIKETGACSADVQEVATEIFEETANAEEIVGYYIMYHKESALKDWIDNTANLESFSEKDREVDVILKRLFS